MKAYLSHADFEAIKRELRIRFPDIKWTHCLEAIARGLGFDTLASLKVALTNHSSACQVQEQAFSSYLVSKGFADIAPSMLLSMFEGHDLGFVGSDELPLLIDATEWEFKKTEEKERFPPHLNSWVGYAPDGRQWYIPMHGRRYGYREMVASKLMQSFGWSHQSSTLIKLADNAAPRIGTRRGNFDFDIIQGASVLVSSHDIRPCEGSCELNELMNQRYNANDQAQVLVNSRLPSAIDEARAFIAGYLFGAHEVSREVFTPQHRVVIVGSEYLFASAPVEPTDKEWFRRKDGGISDAGYQLTMEVCEQVASLTDACLRDALEIPAGIKIDRTGEIKKIAFAAREYARHFPKKWAVMRGRGSVAF